MPVRVAINGFGRIGRQAFKLAMERPELEVVAINDIGDVANMAYLLKYDTDYRHSNEKISAEGSTLLVEGKQFPQQLHQPHLPALATLMMVGVLVEPRQKWQAPDAERRVGARKFPDKNGIHGMGDEIKTVDDHYNHYKKIYAAPDEDYFAVPAAASTGAST